MHYHLEIIMPPTDDVEGAVAKIMKPFVEEPDLDGLDEDDRAEAEYQVRYAFWDWYVIGGRWAGTKFMNYQEEGRLEGFEEALTAAGVTVSGLRCGKQSLEPASQIPVVNELWRQHFPESPFEDCPMFAHSGDQYTNSIGWPDVMRLKEIPAGLTAHRVILAGPGWDEGALAAHEMLAKDLYNGCSIQKTAWDGSVVEALEGWKERFKNARPEWREAHLPTSDWLVVTVDYHS